MLPSFLYVIDALDIFAQTPVDVGAQDLFGPTRAPSPVRSAAPSWPRSAAGTPRSATLSAGDSSARTDDVIAAKTAAALRNGLTPMLCVGETLRDTAASAAEECRAQLDSALSASSGEMASGPVVVAYEPQWAIGAAEPPLPITSPTCRGRCAAIWTRCPGSQAAG